MAPNEPDDKRLRPDLRLIDGGRRGTAKIIQLFCEGRLDEVEAELERMEARRARIRPVPSAARQTAEDPTDPED